MIYRVAFRIEDGEIKSVPHNFSHYKQGVWDNLVVKNQGEPSSFGGNWWYVVLDTEDPKYAHLSGL